MFRGVRIETKKSSVRGRLIVVVIAIITVIVIERRPTTQVQLPLIHAVKGVYIVVQEP